VHRDIKPSNILLAPDDRIKLTDFGIASRTGDPRLTGEGMALGSLFYMSPEQMKAEPVDARSDLYSVGVTLYEMVTAEPIMSRACCTTWSCAVCCKKERAKYPAVAAPAPKTRIKIKLNFKRRRIGRTLYPDRCGLVPHSFL